MIKSIKPFKEAIIMDKKLRIGIFGARRGCGLAQGLTLTEKAYISAVCDYDESTYESIKKYCCEETKFFTDFNEFIERGCLPWNIKH